MHKNQIINYQKVKISTEIQFKNLPLDIESSNTYPELKIESHSKDSFSKDEGELSPSKGDSPIEKALFKLEKTVLKRKNEL